MNTRFAAIAGTLLVGISLFVTALISSNLKQTTSFSSNAQTSCTVSTFNLGNASYDPAKGCYRYWSYDGPGISAACSDGRAFKPSNATIRAWIIRNYGDTCFTEAKWKEIAQAWCCANTTPTNTLTPSTGPNAPSLTPINVPGCQPEKGPHWGKKCGVDGFTCCGGLDCKNTDNGAECIPVPTKAPCDTGFISGKTCAQVKCCLSEPKCQDLQGNAYCPIPPTVVPSSTPTPTASLSGCYNERCNFDPSGNPTCSGGRTCVVIGSPSQKPNPDICSGRNDCRCVVNTKCELNIFIPPGQPGYNDAEACWCLDPNKCLPENRVTCELNKPNQCPDHMSCKQVCFPNSNPDLPPTCFSFGVCHSDFCPKPSETPGGNPLNQLRDELQRNPALEQDIIRRSPANLLDVIKKSQETIVPSEPENTSDNGLMRIFNFFR